MTIQSHQGEPEQEICGDGQDNDGNGQIDENCDVSNPPEGDDSIHQGILNRKYVEMVKIMMEMDRLMKTVM